MTKKQKNYRLGLFIAYLVIWALLAINPVYREDWLLENILVFAGVPFLFWLDRRSPLSGLSYTLIFIFMVLHTYGSHYTYSETPAGRMVSDWLGLERNHYDRFVHFLWGFLLTIPLFEIFRKKVSRKRLVLDFIFAGSILLTFGVAYEFMEWAAAVVVAPEAGTAFLGTQGDVWDAQKDLLMNVVGTFAAIIFWPFVVKHPVKHEA
jgi:putative membrane protein